jgi:hypothetical protein
MCLANITHVLTTMGLDLKDMGAVQAGAFRTEFPALRAARNLSRNQKLNIS